MDLVLEIVTPQRLPLGVPQSLTAGRQGVVIGRGEAADWCLPDPDQHLSRRHCRIDHVGGGYWLVDLSMNGTSVNGRRLPADGRHCLRDGDTIGIGDYLLTATLRPSAGAAAHYRVLVERAQRNDPALDWRQLRFAFLDCAEATADLGERSQAMFKAFVAGDWQAALALAGALIEISFVHIDAHIVSDLALRRLGEEGRAGLHCTMANRLLDSILTRSGRSPDQAFEVISLAEEYSVLSVLGLELQRQSLVIVDGRHYDRMAVQDRAGHGLELYFNVDTVMAIRARA